MTDPYADLPKQPCDGCTFCCKVMGVAELNKPPNVWCTACNIGVGCAGYGIRPKSCVDFECAYAQGLMGAKPEARPDRAKVVFGFTRDGKYPIAYVEPSRPRAWEEGEAGRWFRFLIAELGRGYVICGEKRLLISRDLVSQELAPEIPR